MKIAMGVKPHPEWRIVVELMCGLEYGQTITHDAIALATGLRYDTRAYWSATRQARKVMLRDHEIEIEAVRGVGYRRVEPQRYTERALRDVRLGNRRHKRGGRVAAAAPQALLTDAQNKVNADLLAKIGSLVALARRTLREVARALPPSKPDIPRLLAENPRDDEDATKH